MLQRSLLLALASACLLPAFAATASGRPTGAAAPLTATSARANVALPAPASARSIVSTLWAKRERALAASDAAALAQVESFSAQQQDNAVITMRKEKWGHRKDPHPAMRVVVHVPARSVQPAFFASVRTTNVRSGQHPWYVVAVQRTDAGWKIGFIVLGGYKAAPPLPLSRNARGYTQALTPAVKARIDRLAGAWFRSSAAKSKRVEHNDLGETIRSQGASAPDTDGIYGLPLPGGRVLSCFTLHVLEAHSFDSGLLQEQDETRGFWGTKLAPGRYKTIVVDMAAPFCAVGRGTGAGTGALALEYEQHQVAIRGIRP